MEKFGYYLLSLMTLLCVACSGDDTAKDDNDNFNGLDDQIAFTPCENGMAGDYPCKGYDLIGKIPLSWFDASSANDVWGWTDPSSAKEYAIIGLNNATAFVDITDDNNLIYLGKLPTATSSSGWRDIKVYNNHAYIVSEADQHGIQVFDLARLRDVNNGPTVFENGDGHYTGIGNAHNIVINEDTGFAYPVGTSRDDQYNGGVHFIDLQDPKNPVAAGGFGDNGYTHDAQVITYNGPDVDYTGAEIFIGANENQVAIVNVTDKANPAGITTFGYQNIAYTHQGWFTDDQRYFILGDELDEVNFGFNSRTLVFDLLDLDNPVLHATYTGQTTAIDHNGYVVGDQFFLANYQAGVRVLDISDIEGKTISEEGFFDTYPSGNIAGFEGVWSVYPYFSSGKIAVSDINSGLYIIKKSE